ncbi:MAG TPA: exodeoxyribonuclease VII large subunit [Kofleriaceae bacterium]|nr:exodeoxyribonuclease VII large subunit [Kofleriaceae bacterium]
MAEAAAPVPSREHPLGVAELVRRAGQALDRIVGLVWVEGEVAQCSRPASGHVYFTLKDGASAIPAVMWRTNVARLRAKLEQGVRVRVRGRLGIYDRDGKMQLYVDFVEPAGLGAEAAALEELKKKLAAEGLFARKRPLPAWPRRIGVVTSATGAAVKDIIRTIERRCPTPILIADCVVQGPSAPRMIVHAMTMISRANVDVVIVGRGGGAATDLAAFNDERVVRAVAACPVPVVSAVGHEIDLTLCDLAADRRASTPTAAAELCVPVLADLAGALAKEERRLGREMGIAIRHARHDLDRAAAEGEQALRAKISLRAGALAKLEKRLIGLHPKAQLATRRHALAALDRRLATVITRKTTSAQHALGSIAARLDAMSPLRVLDRGYALVTKSGEVVKDAAALERGDRVDVRLARGAFAATVDDVQSGEP